MIIKYDKQKELSGCSFVKTILMILVVFYHSIIYFGGSWFDKSPIYQSQALAILAEWFHSFLMYAFVLVSGYLFYYLKQEKGKYDRFVPFLLNKAKRLLIPYAFICCVWVIPMQWAFLRYDFEVIAQKYIFGISPSQLWFLLMLFFVFLIFYPFSNFFEQHNVLGIVIVGLFYALGLIANRYLPNIYQIATAFMYIPFFWLGFKIRQYGSLWIRKIHAFIWLILDCVLFAIYKLLTALDGTIFALMELCVVFLLHIVGALMAFVILQMISERIPEKNGRLFVTLGKCSMPIYLFHQQIIYISIYFLNGFVHPFLHSIINFVFSILASYLISALLMKFKWSRILIGEK